MSDFGAQRLTGRVAFVSGGLRGIGLACVERFLAEGAEVVLSDLDASDSSVATEVMARLGQAASYVQANATLEADWQRARDLVQDRHGKLHILVNNAGTSKRGKFLELQDEEWAADLELKVFGAIRCTRLAIPYMKKQGGGRVINITISGAKQPAAESYPTSISRAAGLAITKALSKEFAPDNILVNTICIGKIKSGQHERRFTKDGISADDYYGKMSKDIPMKRVGEAQEVANVITFLASNAASYVTGTSINLDGGISGVL